MCFKSCFLAPCVFVNKGGWGGLLAGLVLIVGDEDCLGLKFTLAGGRQLQLDLVQELKLPR